MEKKSKQQDVLVIGAGASGMMTAITAARRGLSVTVLEHMDKPGKKILATGNGKCNFTNLKMSPRCYYGDHGLVQEILKQFTVEDTLAFFREIGIWPKEKNGYVYPNSGQASSVADALSAEMKRSGVSLVTSCDIRQLCETKYGFEVRTSMGTYCSHNLVFATGLRAAPKSGSDGSMISLIKSFGHRFEPILPALCGFEAEGMEFSKVSGVRTDALLSLYIDGQNCKQERGELQLADYGISGIPVFQVSSPASKALYQKKQAELTINFLPDFSEDMLAQELQRRFSRDAGIQDAAESLRGLLNHKLIPVILKAAGIPVHEHTERISQKQIETLSRQIQTFPVRLKKVRDFSAAQVCTGGIHTEEIHTDTLESRIVPGIYFVGELLALALVSQILGQGLLAYCLGKANACLSSLITLSQPVVAALYAWVIFNESFNLQTIIAILITLTGVYLAKTQTSTNIAQEKA